MQLVELQDSRPHLLPPGKAYSDLYRCAPRKPAHFCCCVRSGPALLIAALTACWLLQCGSACRQHVKSIQTLKHSVNCVLRLFRSISMRHSDGRVSVVPL